jgi:hypothetical protein
MLRCRFVDRESTRVSTPFGGLESNFECVIFINTNTRWLAGSGAKQTYGVLTIAPERNVRGSLRHMNAEALKRTSHNVEHVPVIRCRCKRRGLSTFGGLEHANCCAMHVTAQERNANSSAQGKSLKSFNELIALCLAKYNEPKKNHCQMQNKDLVVRGRPMVILFIYNKKQLA